MTEIEEDKSDEDDAETVMNQIDNLSDNCPSEGMDTNYDMIGLAQDGNKYQMGVKRALTQYNELQAADEMQSRAPIDVDKVVKSKSLLGVEIEVYLNMKRDHAILVITDGTLVMLYKSNMGIVINPVHVDNIAKMYIAQNVPSAAALEFKEEVEQKMGRSHLILESPSMGLFLRYLCETTNIEVDFCSQVQIRVGTREEEFEFEEIPLFKEQEQNAYSSGFVRSVTQLQELFEFKEGSWTSNDEWLRRHAVITNIGVFVWNEKTGKKAIPQFFGWQKFEIKAKSAREVLEKRKNLVLMKHGDQEEHKTFSFTQNDEMKAFLETAKGMLQQFNRAKAVPMGNPSSNGESQVAEERKE